MPVTSSLKPFGRPSGLLLMYFCTMAIHSPSEVRIWSLRMQMEATEGANEMQATVAVGVAARAAVAVGAVVAVWAVVVIAAVVEECIAAEVVVGGLVASGASDDKGGKVCRKVAATVAGADAYPS